MNENVATYLGIILFFVGISVGYVAATDYYRNKAVEYECAQYDMITGEFEWRTGE